MNKKEKKRKKERTRKCTRRSRRACEGRDRSKRPASHHYSTKVSTFATSSASNVSQPILGRACSTLLVPRPPCPLNPPALWSRCSFCVLCRPVPVAPFVLHSLEKSGAAVGHSTCGEMRRAHSHGSRNGRCSNARWMLWHQLECPARRRLKGARCHSCRVHTRAHGPLPVQTETHSRKRRKERKTGRRRTCVFG